MNMPKNAATDAMSVLDDVIAVNLQFTIWTGRKTLKEGDLIIQGKTPPKEVINLGSKHTTDPEALKVFHTLKRRAERLCSSIGIPFMNGYAIPTDKANYIAKELHKIVNEFEIVEKPKYLAKHESNQIGWAKKYPEWTEVLKKAFTPVTEVEGKIRSTFSMFQLTSADSFVQVDSGLNNQVTQLSGTLESEVLKESASLLEKLDSAIHPNQTNVNGLKKLREKVQGLSFLDSKFSSLINVIEKIEAKMPITGKLSMGEKNMLAGLLYRMSDSERIKALMTDTQSSPEISQAALQPVETVFELNQFPTNQESAFNNEVLTFDASEFEFDVEIVPVPQEQSPALNATFF